MSQFNVYDIVELNSGGPRMIVVRFRGLDMVEVVWYDDQQQMIHDVFNKDCLKKVEDKPKKQKMLF